MRLLPSSLSLFVALLAAACRKEPVAAPEPALLGRWTEQSNARVSYDAARKVTGQRVQLLGELRVEFTRDSMRFYRIRTQADLGGYRYSRQGNTLTIDDRDCFIKELSAAKLVIRYPGHPANVPYTEDETTYSR